MASTQPAKGDSPAAGQEEEGISKRSFAQVLGKAMKDDLDNKPMNSTSFRKEGSPTLLLSDSDVSRGASHVSNHVVVLKFSSFQPSLDSIRDSIHKSWGISGEFIMGLIDQRHVLVYLQSEEEVKKVLSKDSFTIRGVRYKIFRWHPGFSLRADPELAPIWIELPNLHFAFFLPAIMKAIGNSVGNFLRIDDGTRYFARPKVARMCVEMEVTKPLPHKIWLESPKYGGYWQQLEYPGFKYCDHCSLIGHEKDFCRKLVGNKKEQSNDDGENHKEAKNSEKDKQFQKRYKETQGQNVNKQMYVPVTKKSLQTKEKIGTSGAKDSQGAEILSEKEKGVKSWDGRAPNISLANKFGALVDEYSKEDVVDGDKETKQIQDGYKKADNHSNEENEINLEESSQKTENTQNILSEAGYTTSEVDKALHTTICDTTGNQQDRAGDNARCHDGEPVHAHSGSLKTEQENILDASPISENSRSVSANAIHDVLIIATQGLGDETWMSFPNKNDIIGQVVGAGAVDVRHKVAGEVVVEPILAIAQDAREVIIASYIASDQLHDIEVGEVNNMPAANISGVKEDNSSQDVNDGEKFGHHSVKQLTVAELNEAKGILTLPEIEYTLMMINEYEKGNEVPSTIEEAIAKRGKEEVKVVYIWLKDVWEEDKNRTSNRLRQENYQVPEEEHEPGLYSDDNVITESAAKTFSNTHTKDFGLCPRKSNKTKKANKRYKG